jgi:hypothetical protein
MRLVRLLCVTSIVILFSCRKNDSETKNFVSYFTDTTLKKTGADTMTAAELSRIPYITQADSSIFPFFSRIGTQGANLKKNGNGTVPKAWTILMPTPKKQLFDDCVGYAVGYGTLSYQYGIVEGTSLNSLDKVFSPAYIYSQLNGGVDRGCDIGDAMRLLNQQGCSKWSDLPPDNWIKAIGLETRIKAADYKTTAYRQVPRAIDQIKYYVSRNYPIPFIIGVDEGFMTGIHPASFEYAKTDDRLIWHSNAAAYKGLHAMVICGYDDDINAFKILNSWGTAWGNSGFIWMDYDYFLSKNFAALFLMQVRTVITDPIKNLTDKSATAGGRIVFNALNNISEKGIVYGFTKKPAVDDPASIRVSAGSSANNFSIPIQGLQKGKHYYMRAYAINNARAEYGNEIEFTPGGDQTLEGKWEFHVRCAGTSRDLYSTVIQLPEKDGSFSIKTVATDYDGKPIELKFDFNYDKATDILNCTAYMRLIIDPNWQRIDYFSVSLSSIPTSYFSLSKLLNNNQCLGEALLFKLP